MRADLPVVLAVTGASGAIYAVRAARALLIAGLRLEIIISRTAEVILKEEVGYRPGEAFVDLLTRTSELEPAGERIIEFGPEQMDAPVSSGSHAARGMVIVPCSMKTLSAVAVGASRNLIERAADVTLKERRPLILVPRESPLSRIHLRNMLAAAEAGATIAPAAPAFYHKPRDFNDLADFLAGRILSLLGCRHDLFPAWGGERDE